MTQITSAQLELRFRNLFEEGLSDAVENSEIDFEGDLINSQILDFNSLSEAELYAINYLELRAVLANVFPYLISFNTKKLRLWAKDAVKFYENNFEHENFSYLFSSGLNYNIIIQESMSFEYSTNHLKKLLEDLSGVNLDGKISSYFTQDFKVAIESLAEEAIGPALGALARELSTAPPTSVSARTKRENQLQRLKRLERNPSYKDPRGLVPFKVLGDKLEIGGQPAHQRIKAYRPQLDRAISRISEKKIIERIHNQDPEITALFREYSSIFEKEADSASVVELWFVGSEIETRLKAYEQPTSAAEELDRDTVILISAFLTAHSLYMQTFPEIERLSEDAERAANLYRRIDSIEQRSSFKLLERLAVSDELFAQQTQGVMKSASRVSQTINNQSKKGIVAICLGLLRGSLKAMAGLVIHSCLDAVTESADDTLEDVFKSALSSGGLEQKTIEFFIANSVSAIRLSENLPIYFSWIKPFLTMINLS